MSFWEKAQQIDRRWIFLITLLVVAVVIIYPVGLPIDVGPDAQNAYNLVNKIQPGQDVFIWISYSFGATAQLDDMLAALSYHLMKKGAHIVVVSRTPEGAGIAQNVIQPVASKFKDYKDGYGTTWINIGYRPNPDSLLRASTSNFVQAYSGNDFTGKDIASYPIAKELAALDKDHFPLAIVMDDTDGYAQFINVVQQPKGVTTMVGAIQMEVPVIQPYVQAKQIAAFIPGSTGAAQYEHLIGRPGGASAQQDAISLAAIYVFVLVVIGNIGYLMTRQARAS